MNNLKTIPDDDEQWVRRLNIIAREMDEVCDSLHPAAWKDSTADLRKKWEKLVKEEN